MKKKIISAFSVLIALVLLVPSLIASATVTGFRDQVTDGVNYVGYFEVDGNVAVCIQHSRATPGAVLLRVRQKRALIKNSETVLYYGSHGPGTILEYI